MSNDKIIHTTQIPSKTWWEMRRLKYNLIVGCVGIIMVIIINIWMTKGANFDWFFFLSSIIISIIYAFICNLSYTLIWMLDNMNFNNELVEFYSPKRTIILYLFVMMSCFIPFGILYLVITLL